MKFLYFNQYLKSFLTKKIRLGIEPEEAIINGALLLIWTTKKHRKI